MREVVALGLPTGPTDDSPIAEADLGGLPDSAQHYLRFMGVVGSPRDWSFRLGFTGRFRGSQRGPWMKCEAWQYNSGPAVARIFHIRIRFAGVVPVLARDTYVDGRGRMLIRLLDRFTLGDGSGEEFDTGELVTYLNDGIFIAPSMLLVRAVKWSSVDAKSFDIAISDHGRTVSARVFIDERGAPINFSTTDRFFYDSASSKQLVRARWTTPVEGWREEAGRRVWTGAQAIWHLRNGEFAYADFSPIPGALAFNVRPSEED